MDMVFVIRDIFILDLCADHCFDHCFGLQGSVAWDPYAPPII
jgi:hypothetical protein